MSVPRRLRILVAVTCLYLALPVAADDGPIRLQLRGDLVDLAVVDGEDGSQALALLVREEDEASDEETDPTDPEMHLYRFEMASRTLSPQPVELPASARDLLPGRSAAEPGLWVAARRFGSLELLPIPGDAAPPRRHELPRRASRRSWGLLLSSPTPRSFSGPPDDAPRCFAAAPEAHGRRLRVALLCGDGEPEDAWVTLPRDERVSGSAFGYLDGEPALAVLTHEKVGPFVQQDLRVFRLAPSRNRMGGGPVFSARTDCPLWRPLDLSWTDADGDGRRDVLLVCEKGLLDQELRVELYRAAEPGGRAPFDRAAVRQLEGDFGAWRMREDLTGDGRADLVIYDEGRVSLYPGSPGRRPLDTDPVWSALVPFDAEPEGSENETTVEVTVGRDVDVERWTGGPRLVGSTDLDGDGRSEVLVHRRREGGDVVVILER